MKTGKETHSVLELDQEGLPVEDVPGALHGPDVLPFEYTVGFPRALGSHNIPLINNFDFKNVSICQLEFVILCDNLQLVGQAVGANLSLLIEIEFILFWADVEGPCLANIVDIATGLFAINGQVAQNWVAPN